MSEHPIQGLMDTTLKKIKQMVDMNTIIGDAISHGDVKLLNVSNGTNEKAIAMVPELVDKISGLFKKDKKDKPESIEPGSKTEEGLKDPEV